MGNLLKRVVVRTYALSPSALRVHVTRWLTPNYTAGVVILLVRENGEVLLERQTYRHGWALPGGLVARGERPSLTAQREVEEELGIRIPEPAVYRVAVNAKAQTFTSFAIAFVDEDQIANMKIDPVEIASVQWFPVTGLPQMDERLFPIAPGDRQVVQDFLKNR